MNIIKLGVQPQLAVRPAQAGDYYQNDDGEFYLCHEWDGKLVLTDLQYGERWSDASDPFGGSRHCFRLLQPGATITITIA